MPPWSTLRPSGLPEPSPCWRSGSGKRASSTTTTWLSPFLAKSRFCGTIGVRTGGGRFDDQHHTNNPRGESALSNESGAVLTEQEEVTETDSSAMTMEDYLHYESEAFKTPNHGDIVDGIVVRVDADEVLVDIGAKAEGVISSKELGLRGEVDSVGLEPGDQIKVYVLQPENEEGNVVLSLRRARAETTWIVAAEKQTDGSVIEADVREQNKGGLIVNVLGLRGFLPSSQVARAYAGSLESLVGQRIPVKILEVNRKRNRLIVSQKAAEDEDRARKREDLFSRLLTGTTVKGTVSGITSYGAFVDIGGADGLIHISELSWDRVSKVTDVLQLGDEVTVKVIKLDPEQTRISLSLRQLQQDPWEKLVQSMPIGSIVEGQVTKTKKYGAFLQIMAGIEGLLHISELSWDHVERTEDVLKVGETLQVKVIGIDTARRRISLSLKQLSAPPASLAASRSDRRPDEYEDVEDES
ncbi:MAG: 30S ribosomal protein S1 [Chloroflexi bacterium]|nr:MAG: 30S ribosomal protein S1 [Chloroflexota bacterium]